ncbi:hypothetical protein PIB30_075132 [Stylosanthes scabra]|uniref:Uncharacterized protein n=1 Tax=Stylosanthes scabra TaxID=79078 RepID=A0ABU6TPI0_9FABA|nr:hypothetical protein [Stylosanthes scabra]
MPIVDEVSIQQMFQCYHQKKSHVSSIELYVEFEQVIAEAVNDVSHVDLERQTVLEEMDSGSEDEFEANYEAPDKEEGDEGVDVAVQNVTNQLASQHPFGVPSCMRQLDNVDINAPEFPEYANIGMLIVESISILYPIRRRYSVNFNPEISHGLQPIVIAPGPTIPPTS